MKSNPYSMKPKGKPHIAPSPPKKQSLAGLLQKYEKDLCEEVMLRMNNELPIVEMIQAEKQRPIIGFETRMEQSKKTPWSKKLSDKENAGEAQMNTPISKQAHNYHPAERSDISGFAHQPKSPINSARPPEHSGHQTAGFVYKVKEGKIASLKDLISGYNSQPSPVPEKTMLIKPSTATVQQYGYQTHQTNQLPVTHGNYRGKTQHAEVPMRLISAANYIKKSQGTTPPESESQGDALSFEPSFATNDIDVLQGLDLSQEEQSKFYDQIKEFQDRLISIFTGNSMKHLPASTLKEIRQNINRQVHDFAKSLLAGGVAVGSQKSQAGTSKTEQDSRRPDQPEDSSEVHNKNHSLFFSFESPISLRQDTNQAEDDQFGIAGLVPDKPDSVVQVVQLGRPPNKIVNNVAMVVSKQMMDSKGSEAARLPTFQPAIRLDEFPWMKSAGQAGVSRPELPDDGLGFRVDLNLNNSSDLQLSRSLIEKKEEG